MRYSDDLIDHVRRFLVAYDEFSPRVEEALQEGDVFVLTFVRGSRLPISWTLVYESMELVHEMCPGTELALAKFFELAERETQREALIRRIEEEIDLVPTSFQ